MGMFGTKNCDGCTKVTTDRYSFCSVLGDFLTTGCKSNWWLRQNCGKSCGICRKSLTSGNTCSDSLGRRCRRLKTRCSSSRYLQSRCKKTCGQCSQTTCKDQLSGNNCQMTCGLCTSSGKTPNCTDRLGRRCFRFKRSC